MVELTIPDELLNQVTQAVAAYQPKLGVSICNGVIVLEGPFVLFSSKGPCDAYDVEIYVFGDFPQKEPVVFETGGRIPKTLDRHVFPGIGNCCLGLWEEWLQTVSDPSFSEFLTGCLNDYFVSQSWFEVKGEWPYGERSHGTEGIIESYADVLGVTKDFKIVVDYLTLLTKPVVKGHVSCPCSSGKRLRHCHRNDIMVLREQINPTMANRMLNRIAQNFSGGPSRAYAKT